MLAYYDQKPSKFEAVGNGSYLYRYNITEVGKSAAEENAEQSEQSRRETQWRCEEVVVWAPVSADKITEAVISDRCPLSRELKLVNDFNSVSLGLCSDDEQGASEKAQRYHAYLTERKTLKEQVDADCVELGIR